MVQYHQHDLDDQDHGHEGGDEGSDGQQHTPAGEGGGTLISEGTSNIAKVVVQAGLAALAVAQIALLLLVTKRAYSARPPPRSRKLLLHPPSTVGRSTHNCNRALMSKRAALPPQLPAARVADCAKKARTELLWAGAPLKEEPALSPASCTRLNDGNLLPWLGLGTYKLKEKDGCERVVGAALKYGYRAIDSAFVYGNEKAVGAAIRACGVPRKQIVVTTKQWRKFHGYEATNKNLNTSLKRLGLGHIDLYLMHWPGPGYWSLGKSKEVLEDPNRGPPYYFSQYEGEPWSPSLRTQTWKAMEDSVKEGKVKSIGVCNMTVKHLKELLKEARIVPAVNQVEFHPYLFDAELLQFCRDKGIQMQAYASLGGQDTPTGLHEEAAVVSAAKSHGKTSAQVLLRWALQHQVVIIPKSRSVDRVAENLALFDFELSEVQMRAINQIGENRKQRLCWKRDPLRNLEFE